MKLNYTLILFASLAFASLAHARDYALVFSPWGEPQAVKTEISRALEFLVSLEPGDQALLIDGYHLRTLGEFVVPEDKRYSSPKALVNFNRETVSALMQFARLANPPTGDNAPAVPRAVKLPQVLRHLVAQTETKTEVIVFGSSLYDDPSEAAFSMAGGQFPGDGHLSVGVGQSVFGAEGGDLSRLRVHILHRDGSYLSTSRHLHFIERWWSLYLQAQDGALVSFSSDIASVFSRAKRQAEPVRRFTPNETDKLEMIDLAPVQIERSIFERPLSSVVPSDTALRRARNVELGLSWDCQACDLDLYARAFPGAPVLSYQLTSSAHGRYWKDYQSSPEATNGKESIQFVVPIDLRATLIGINLYKGPADVPINAELRISIDGQTFAKTFTLQPSAGNRGQDVAVLLGTGPGRSSYTIVRSADQLLGS